MGFLGLVLFFGGVSVYIFGNVCILHGGEGVEGIYGIWVVIGGWHEFISGENDLIGVAEVELTVHI